MMSATVTWSFEGSPPCSWESLLGEGSISLKHQSPLLNYWNDCRSYNNQCVDSQSSPSCPSWDVVFFSSCWNMNQIGYIHVSKICRIVINVICCNCRIDNLKSFGVWIIFDVSAEECNSKVCGCVLCELSKIIMNCSCGDCAFPCVVIKSGLYVNCNDLS